LDVVKAVRGCTLLEPQGKLVPDRGKPAENPRPYCVLGRFAAAETGWLSR